MSIGLRLSHAIGIDPNDTTHAVYVNRADVGEWEAVTLVPHGDRVEVVFIRTQRRLTITPDGQLESRALTDPLGEWEQLTLSADGKTVSRAGVTLTVEGDLSSIAPSIVIKPPVITPAIVVPQRLHVEGLRFVTEGGEPWVMAFATSFRAYERFLRGEDLRPHLKELAELGGNGIRVFGAFDYGSPQTQRLYPREHPEYYDRLAEFFALLRGFGLYAQFCVFADTARSVPGKAAQLAHWARVVDVLRPIENVLLERVNENDQHDNRVDADVPRPAGMCASFGSNGGGQDPPGPYWDYADLHSERRGDFALSTTTVNFAIKGYKGEGGAKSFAGTQRATVVSEPPGIADALVPGRRTNDPRICYQMGVGCSTWGAGGTAHSDCGVQSIVLTPVQKECVRQFFNGVRLIKLS